MTSYELLSLAAKFQELSFISGGLFLTVVSGFLVMAYTVGDKLTRIQSVFVSFLFLTASLIAGYGAIGYGALSDYFFPSNYNSPDRKPFSILDNEALWTPNTGGMVIGTLIMLGSLLFLYDVRKKSDQRKITSETEGQSTAEGCEVQE